MEIVLATALLIVGLYILIVSSDFLVDGAASVAYKFNIAPIVVGLTIVAFGTSAPELLVSVTSAVQGSTELALGNVVGSNIVNILLILGIGAIIYPMTVSKNTVWKEIPFAFLSAIIVTIFGLQQFIDQKDFSTLNVQADEVVGSLNPSAGLVLLTLFVIFMYYTFSIAKISPTTGDEGSKPMPLTRSIFMIIGGLIGLALGSTLTVQNAVSLAQAFNISERLIGLSIISIGTSLPELVTGVSAALKRHSEIVIGNVVGSNIFNTLFVLSSSIIIAPSPLYGSDLVDLIVLLFTTGFLFFSFFIFSKYTLGRIEGGMMLFFYATYMGYIFIRG